MFLERIETPGLVQFSYIVGSEGVFAVVDPRRDCQVYLDTVRSQGGRITHIFETHRNEDFVVGSKELAEITGAGIYHGEELDFAYGLPAREGDEFHLGQVRLKVLKTPGHTPESISLVIHDLSTGDAPIGVFTGDALFIGGSGRTDFYPGQEEEMAGQLYDSIFSRLLPLGDQTVVYPAHGAGSACGEGLAERKFSTLGYERLCNPDLQAQSREAFIQAKQGEEHSYPPYFSRMEKYNLDGPPAIVPFNSLQPMGAEDFGQAMQEGMLALDVRSPEAYCGAFIPGSLSVPLDMLPRYAGWFVALDQEVGLIAESHRDLDSAWEYLLRLGFDRVRGWLEGGLHEWSVQGKRYEHAPVVFAGELQRRLSSGEDFTILDVRTRKEFHKAHLPGAQHIFLGELPQRMQEIGPGRPVTAFCGSGKRAVIAVSLLRQHGIREVENCLGSIQACSRSLCEIVSS